MRFESVVKYESSRSYCSSVPEVLRHASRASETGFGTGHDVPEDKVRSRYERVLALLPEYIGLADDAAVFDNSDRPRLVLSKRDGVLELAAETPD